MKKNSLGFTLIELLFSLFLSSLLLIFLVLLFSQFHQVFEKDIHLLYDHHRERFLSFYLPRQLKRTTVSSFGFPNRLKIINANEWQNSIIANWPIHPKEGSDIIYLKYVSPSSNRYFKVGENQISINLSEAIHKNDALAIYDAYKTVICHVKYATRFNSSRGQKIVCKDKIPQISSNSEAAQIKIITLVVQTDRYGISELYQIDSHYRRVSLVSHITGMTCEKLISHQWVRVSKTMLFSKGDFVKITFNLASKKEFIIYVQL